MLAKLINDGDWRQVLVFTRTKHGANRLAAFLNDQGLTAAAIHGNKSQGARTKALADFKSGDVRILVATDIAARGIDIPQLPQVVNFELPKVAEDYVHRIGRTGRAGETGKAISLVCALEAPELFAIERLIQAVLPRQTLQGYAPSNEVPESKLDTRPIKPKKPKKAKKPKAPESQTNKAEEGQSNATKRARSHSKPNEAGKPGGRNKPQGQNSANKNGKAKRQFSSPEGSNPAAQKNQKPNGPKPANKAQGQKGKTDNAKSSQRRKPRPQNA